MAMTMRRMAKARSRPSVPSSATAADRLDTTPPDDRTTAYPASRSAASGP
jgi:hypothetical protein